MVRSRDPKTRPAGGEPPDDLELLIHELRHHQTELELQNAGLREAQQYVGLSHERYRQLFELAPVSYLSLDQDGRITDANRAAAILLRRERTQLTGTRFARYLVAEHAGRFELHRRQVLSAPRRCGCDLEIECALGKRRVVRVESLRAGSAVADWLMAIVDLTEVQRLERDLQEARRLEAIGTLASGVAHDFNNLLMGVLGCADIALERLTPESDTHALVAAIRESVIQGRSVVSQLLTFARSSSVESELVELDAVVHAGARLLRDLLGNTVELRLDLRAPGVRVHADAGQLQQIVMNLASNARHAMPAGGVFSLETRTIAASDGALGACTHVRLRASDTGHGMDRTTLARAFEPFFTTKTSGEGTGLGLSMVYGAVRQAGGRIELESAVGEGTRVEIDWPLVMPPRMSSNGQAAERDAGPLRVLVVDDERLVRMSVRHYLEKIGCEVLEATSAEQGLEVLGAQTVSVDLLVTDVMLPGLKGPELVARVRMLCPQLDALLVSAHSAELLAERGLIAPSTRVLRKPFTPAELYAAIHDTRAPQAGGVYGGAPADDPEAGVLRHTTH